MALELQGEVADILLGDGQGHVAVRADLPVVRGSVIGADVIAGGHAGGGPEHHGDAGRLEFDDQVAELVGRVGRVGRVEGDVVAVIADFLVVGDDRGDAVIDHGEALGGGPEGVIGPAEAVEDAVGARFLVDGVGRHAPVEAEALVDGAGRGAGVHEIERIQNDARDRAFGEVELAVVHQGVGLIVGVAANLEVQDDLEVGAVIRVGEVEGILDVALDVGAEVVDGRLITEDAGDGDGRAREVIAFLNQFEAGLREVILGQSRRVALGVAGGVLPFPDNRLAVYRFTEGLTSRWIDHVGVGEVADSRVFASQIGEFLPVHGEVEPVEEVLVRHDGFDGPVVIGVVGWVDGPVGAEEVHPLLLGGRVEVELNDGRALGP